MMCVMHENMYIFAFFIMFKSLPSLDLCRFVYPHTFSTNDTPIRLESLKIESSSLKIKISSL